MQLARGNVVIITVLIFLALAGVACTRRKPPLAATTPAPGSIASTECDETLWQHVYAGDPKKFSKPQDRLQIIQPCIAVTGTIFSAVAERDGDFHIRVTLDPPFTGLLNQKNISGQSGHLVVEPVCMNPVSQKDTLEEAVCVGFSQHVYSPDMQGKHVRIVGAYVTDMEHGWNEIHPVTAITVVP